MYLQSLGLHPHSGHKPISCLMDSELPALVVLRGEGTWYSLTVYLQRDLSSLGGDLTLQKDTVCTLVLSIQPLTYVHTERCLKVWRASPWVGELGSVVCVAGGCLHKLSERCVIFTSGLTHMFLERQFIAFP